MKFLKNKKGAFEQLGSVALSLVIFVTLLALGSIVLTTMRNNDSVLLIRNSTGAVLEGSEAGNANATLSLNRGLEALVDISDWTAIVVIVLVFGVILGLVYTFYKSRQ